MTRMISLALQGGGAHGAFTWGVLDQLLQDERIEIEAISGTSAGAMNAAAVLCGYSRNGREGAREALEAFWTTISRYAVFSPVQRTWWDQLMGNWSRSEERRVGKEGRGGGGAEVYKRRERDG